MSLYEKIYSKQNTKEIILEKSNEWIKELESKEDCIEKYIAIAHIYFMKELYVFDCTNAEKSCEYFEKIPDEYYGIDLLQERINALKLCYHFDEFLSLSKRLLNCECDFGIRHLVLKELVDYSMVADKKITKEEYFEYKSRLKKLLNNELNYVDKIIP